MSYEISSAKDDNVSPGKYLKIENEDDCQLLLQETSLDDENECQIKDGNNDQQQQALQSTSSKLTGPSETNVTESKLKLADNSTTSNSDSQTLSIATKAQTNKEGDNPKKSSTSKSSSHKSFELSLSSFIRFLSFRKKKNKSHTDTNSVNTSQSTDSPSQKAKYNSLPKRQSKAKNDDASKIEKLSQSTKAENDETEKPNVFSRFVRTFSFLYKRNPNSTSQNFKRSQSVQNYPKTRSLPNIKYSSSQSRLPNSPTSSSSSASRQTGNIKHSTAPSNQTVKRDRAKSDDLQSSNHRTQSNHVSAVEQKISVIDSKPSLDVTETDSSDKISELKESVKKEAGESQNSAIVNRRRHLVSSGLETPGVSGLQNHGNTCYINGVFFFDLFELLNNCNKL